MRKAIVINKITKESLRGYVQVIKEYKDELKGYSLFGSEYRLGLRPGSLEHLGIRHISKLSRRLFTVIGSVDTPDELKKTLTFKMPESSFEVSETPVEDVVEEIMEEPVAEMVEAFEESEELDTVEVCDQTLSVALEKSYKRGDTLWAVFTVEGCCVDSGVLVECASLEYSESFDIGTEVKVTLDRGSAEDQTHLFVFKCAGHVVELEVEL